jgi:pimeloyl-ACP methyl ester carboxylesterase
VFWNLKEAAAEVGGSKIDYAVFGKGKKTMVIIPGLTLRDVKGAGTGLALMYKIFARDYRVYVIDKKHDIPEGCTVDDLARDTAEAMRALGIEGAYVVGVSLGGMIAQRLAIDAPDLVKKLVLCVTASRANSAVEAAIARWVSFAEKGDFGGIVQDMMNVMYSERYVKRYGSMLPLLAKLSKPKNEARFIRLAKACLTCDTYESLGNIACPTLVLGGEDDKIVTGAASLEITEKLGCDVHMYAGLGHSAYEEATDFNLRIKNFFDGEG